MCGIAGMIDLAGRRTAPRGAVAAMARAIVHRGPDEDGFLTETGLELANRRLSIVGLADGQQPISNEVGSVWTVFNGEFFEYPEKRAELEAKGHTFRTHTDTELIPHLWEDHREGLVDHLRGQFAFCVWDKRTNEVVIARDRPGICPLFYTVRKHDGTDWLLFASEMKALFASGLVEPKADPRGLNHVFTFFAMPGPVTVFDGVTMLRPGHLLHLKLGRSTAADVQQRAYYRVEYPDRGQEDYGSDERRVVDGFEKVLFGAVQKRLRADVPVVSYLSGGVDSSLVVAMANKALGRAIPTFTISVQGEGMNEESEALRVARHLGCQPVIVKTGRDELRTGYPELITAAEIPVVDTSCLGLLELARSVHQNGYKVALTGEGADEWLAGYSWFKINKLVGFLDRLPGHVGGRLRSLFLRATGQPRFPFANYRHTQALLGGPNGWMDLYGMMSLNKLRFFTPDLREQVLAQSPWDDLGLPAELHRWHPFNRQMYLGARIMLPGHLLASKGDRVAMHSSVETRYAFLDEDVTAYMATLHPRWKLRGLLKDKFVERKVAERWLPADVAWRRKKMFRAPLDAWVGVTGGWIDQVLSPESVRKAGYFDPEAVAAARAKLPNMRRGVGRTGLEMGLTAVTATQLWHHLYVGGGLCELPTRVPGGPAAAA
ncbi:MAG: asparagine synthase (glutamine-hydrolyzing) [Gemmataceae bacterium]|nr:asparagine synthase (glutamine-hydrolyzing) [Gemmataceae bacterium]